MANNDKSCGLKCIYVKIHRAILYLWLKHVSEKFYFLATISNKIVMNGY